MTGQELEAEVIAPDACVFCGDTGAPKTAEHVLQQAFGTSWTLTRDVCDTCNRERFSPLDTALVDYVRKLAYAHHPDVGGGQTILNTGHPVYLDPNTGDWVSVRIGRDGRAFFQPQLVIRDPGRVAIHVAPESGLEVVQRMLAELAAPQSLAVSEAIVEHIPNDQPPLQPAIVRTARNQYVVRGKTRADVARVRKLLDEGVFRRVIGKGNPIIHRVENPVVHNGLIVPYGLVNRALAKVAMNFLCGAVGPEVARESAFDAARSFVLSDYNEDADPVVLFQPNSAEPEPSKIARKSHHSLLLTEVDPGEVIVEVVLYARRVATIALASGARRWVLPRDTLVVVFFDYRSRTHELLRLGDDPSALGRELGLLPPSRRLR